MKYSLYNNRPPSGGLFFLLLFVLLGCRHQPAEVKEIGDTNEEVIYPFKSTNSKFNHLSAHRGGGDIAGYPENCLESMKYIDEKTGAWMEIDIRKTKDGQLVLMHDASVDRTTNGSGKVSSMTYSQLKKLKLKDNNGRLTDYHPPLLEDVLQWNEKEGMTVLNLDIKQDVAYEDVLKLVHKTQQMDNVVGIVYTLDQAKAMRRLDKDIVISLPVRNMNEWERLKASELPIKNLIAFTGTIRSSPQLYKTLHDNGLLTIFGTMGNIDRQAASRGQHIYEELYKDGADILSTDRPLSVF